MPPDNPPPLPRKNLLSRPTPRLLALASLLLLLAIPITLHLLGSTPPAWYPPCPTRYLTNLNCPGCGAARALHSLAHGHLSAAFRFNALLVLALPFIVFYFADTLIRALRHNLPPRPLPNRTALIIAIIFIAYTIARNIPLPPFTHLAPH